MLRRIKQETDLLGQTSRTNYANGNVVVVADDAPTGDVEVEML
jgi:hypothetical protein